MGHQIFLLHIDLDGPLTSEMKAHWGEHLFSHSYQKPWKKFKLAGIPIPDRISRRLLPLGFLTHNIDQWYDEGISQKVSELHDAHHFDAVIVEYVFLSKALDALPSELIKVIDTHDKYTDRVKQFTAKGIYPEWFFTNKSEEQKGLSRANKVIAIQDKEAEFFRAIASSQFTVHTVGNLATPNQTISSKRGRPFVIAYISGASPQSATAFTWFYEQVFSTLISQLPELELQVHGSICSLLTPQPQLSLRGSFTDPQAVYSQAHCVINPIQIGTGLKMKCVEALAHGKCLLTTSVGIEGLEDAICDDCVAGDDSNIWIQTIEKWHARSDDKLDSLANFSYYETSYHKSRQELVGIFS